MTKITIGGIRDPEAEPGDALHVDGLIGLADLKTAVADLVGLATRLGGIAEAGDLLDPVRYPTGLTPHGARAG